MSDATKIIAAGHRRMAALDLLQRDFWDWSEADQANSMRGLRNLLLHRVAYCGLKQCGAHRKPRGVAVRRRTKRSAASQAFVDLSFNRVAATRC